MPTVPLDQKFHTIAANVATKERGSALVNSQKEIFTMQDVIDTLPSGASGIHSIIKLSSGQSTNVSINPINTASLPALVNILWTTPYVPAQTFTSQDLFIYVQTGVASSNCRILIYSDLNGLPNTKLYESANLDCSTTGIKTATTTFTFTAGTTYWLTLHSDSNPTVWSIQNSGLVQIFVNASLSGISSYKGNATFGSAPTTFPATIVSSGSVPAIWITAS